MINNNQASGSNLQGNTDTNSYQAEISNTVNYAGDNREQVVNPTSQRVTNYASSMINSLGSPNGMNAVPQQFIMVQAPLLQGFNGMPYPASQPMLPVFPNGMNAVPQQFIMVQAPLLQRFNGMPYPASQPMLPVFPNGVNVVPQQLVNPTSQRVTNYASSMINSLGFPNGMNVMPQQIIMSQPLSLYETNGVSHIYQSTLISSIAACKRPNTFEDESISKKQKPSERAELNEVERRFIEKCKHGNISDDIFDSFELENLNDLIGDLGEFQVNINAQDENGCTALMYLSAKKPINWDVVRAFKEKGADLDLVDDQGYTALIHAATWFADPVGAVYGFIQEGANLSATNEDGLNFYDICESRNLWEEDYESFTLLMKKIYEYDHLIFKEIITEFNIRQKLKNYLLISAVKEQNVDMTEFLMENGADINHSISEYPRTYWEKTCSPFVTALQLENEELFYLLLQAGASIRQEVIQDVNSKKKPLSYLVHYLSLSKYVKNLDFESYMLENIQNILTQEEKAYIFNYCLQEGDIRIIEVLIDTIELDSDCLILAYNKSKYKEEDWYCLELFIALIKNNLSWYFKLENLEYYYFLYNLIDYNYESISSDEGSSVLNDLEELLYEDNSKIAHDMLLSLIRVSQEEIKNLNNSDEENKDEVIIECLQVIEDKLQNIQRAFTLHQTRVSSLHEAQLRQQFTDTLFLFSE